MCTIMNSYHIVNKLINLGSNLGVMFVFEPKFVECGPKTPLL